MDGKRVYDEATGTLLYSLDGSNTETPPSEDEEVVENGGLYDSEGNILADWSTLTETYGLDVEKDYDSETYHTETTSIYYILNNYTELSSATKLVISDTVENIGDCAIASTNLTDIEISNNVKNIGAGALCANMKLTSIEIPDSVEIIDETAFSFCMNLESITFGENSKLTEIGENAFGFAGFTSITIPASVTTIGKNPFYASDVANIGVESGNTSYKSINGNLYTIDGKVLVAYARGKTDTTFEMPEGVTEIALHAMDECTNLTSVVIPDSLTKIGEYAFQSTVKLESITFGENSSLDTIELAAFQYSTIKSIEIPSGVTSISERAFSQCSKLESVTITNNVTNIGSYAFGDCESLITINYEGTMEQWESIEFGENWDNDSGTYTVYCTDGEITK